MTLLAEYIEKVAFQDKNFVGTVALRNEELTLPDGSKIALGIDDGHWILVYQQEPRAPFQIFECTWSNKKIFVDKKEGGEAELKTFKKLVSYFLKEARVDDLVTLLPPGS